MSLQNISFPIKQIRQGILIQQLLNNPKENKGKQTAQKIIENLGYVQIDTISVVSRAHHHTIWSRFPEYNEIYLDELLAKDTTIFEYWSHAASYLPIKDFRFSLPRKKEYATGKSHWFEQDKKIKKYVLDKINAEGALQSKDFEHHSKTNPTWYEWKPAKRALEQLFMEGKLMVARRQGFQKVYDLTERVLPNGVNTTFPTATEYAEHLIQNAIKSQGFINENEISYLRSGTKKIVAQSIQVLLDKKIIVEISAKENKNIKLLTFPNVIKSSNTENVVNNLHIFSPFDNLIIQRKRIKTIFDFDYVIECYLPENKRKHGYFVLPVMFNQNFVCRIDAKANRKEKLFEVKSIHMEKHFKPSEIFNKVFAEKLIKFAGFNGCEEIKIESNDKVWKREINNLVKQTTKIIPTSF